MWTANKKVKPIFYSFLPTSRGAVPCLQREVVMATWSAHLCSVGAIINFFKSGAISSSHRVPATNFIALRQFTTSHFHWDITMLRTMAAEPKAKSGLPFFMAPSAWQGLIELLKSSDQKQHLSVDYILHFQQSHTLKLKFVLTVSFPLPLPSAFSLEEGKANLAETCVRRKFTFWLCDCCFELWSINKPPSKILQYLRENHTGRSAIRWSAKWLICQMADQIASLGRSNTRSQAKTRKSRAFLSQRSFIAVAPVRFGPKRHWSAFRGLHNEEQPGLSGL